MTHLYIQEGRQTEKVGNNALSYDERMALGSQGKLFLSTLIDGNVDDVVLGENIVFEEVENDKLISCIGLKNLVKISTSKQTIYITDNHNHALYFRYDALQGELISQGATLLHVDQHADMNTPFEWIDADKQSDMEYIAEYVNTHTQIASFIEPALHSGLVSECVQTRSEAKLTEIVALYEDNFHTNIILDIDIDFFAHEKEISTKMALLKRLLPLVKIVTIATSPFFIDQHLAISLVKELLSSIDK